MNIWEKLTDTSGIVNINKEFEKRYFGTFLEWTKPSGEIVYTYIYEKDETTYHFRLKNGLIIKFDICEDNPTLNTINLKSWKFNRIFVPPQNIAPQGAEQYSNSGHH